MPKHQIQIYLLNTSANNGSSGQIRVLNSTGLTFNTINSRSDNGSGGAINLNSIGDITLNTLDSSAANGQGGDVTLSSSGGAIAVNSLTTSGTTGSGALRVLDSNRLTINTLTSRSSNGSGGAVTLESTGNIILNTLDTSGGVRGGDIRVNSRSGAIDLLGNVSSGNFAGNATPSGASGSINLLADGNITVQGLVNTSLPPTIRLSSGRAGDITITSRRGAIAINQARLDTGTTFGQSGSITLQARNDITLSDLRSYQASNNIAGALGQGGDITVTSTAGRINILPGGISGSQGSLFSSAQNGTAGNITLNARRGITGRSATLNTSASGRTGNAGSITLSTSGILNLTTLNLLVRSNNGSSGNVTLTAGNRIRTGNINTNSNRGDGGAVRLTANNRIRTGNINTNSNQGDGGAVRLTADNRIRTGAITTRSNQGNGGAVTIDPQGDVQINSINAQGGVNGVGGDVNITTQQFLRVTNSFSDRNGTTASISSAAGRRGGEIIIRHGGNGITPFTVGSAATNGTAGAITTGSDNTIAPSQDFFGIYRQGTAPSDIQILTREIFTDPTIYPVSSLNPQFPVPDVSLDSLVFKLEEDYTHAFERLIGVSNTPIKTLGEIRRELRTIEREAGVRPAVIYAFFVSEAIPQFASAEAIANPDTPLKLIQRPSSYLALVLVTGNGETIGVRVPDTTRDRVLQVTGAFSSAVKRRLEPATYLPLAQQVYQWLVAPLKPELDKQNIKNLVFVMEANMRSLPLAAMHDGQQFLIEHYSVGLMPSLSLTDTRYVDIRRAQVLAMGAAQFPASGGLEELGGLRAVPLELAAITRQVWQGEEYINANFTLSQLATQRSRFSLVHLATHAEFNPDDPKASYIRLWDENLSFDEMRTVDWNQPPMDLLVLSACRTAIGDDLSELGFAGLSVQTGSKSALGSLYPVDDVATFILMSKFYEHLSQATIKAEALRLAQVELLHHQNFQDITSLLATLNQKGIPLPQLLQDVTTNDFSHPYYWSAFTLVGNPW